ncbi:MAG: acetate--CoA ligase family protein [Firmicutes bacterium]|nr:acetate--CoA ligase family protein [Bacillota bacterium]
MAVTKMLTPSVVTIYYTDATAATAAPLAEQLRADGFSACHIIHPEAKALADFPAHTSCREFGDRNGLTLFCLPKAALRDAIIDAGQKYTKNALLFCDEPFSDAEWAELMSLTRHYDLQLLGPDVGGLANAAFRVGCGYATDAASSVMLICQDAAFAAEFSSHQPLLQAVCSSNYGNLGISDFLQEAEADQRCRSIIVELNGRGCGNDFLNQLLRCAAKKPLALCPAAECDFDRDMLKESLADTAITVVDNAAEALAFAAAPVIKPAAADADRRPITIFCRNQQMPDKESLDLLENAGIPVIDNAFSTDNIELMAVADFYGYPVNIFAASADIADKYAAGARVDKITDRNQLNKVYAQLMELKKLYSIEGVIITRYDEINAEVPLRFALDTLYGGITYIGKNDSFRVPAAHSAARAERIAAELPQLAALSPAVQQQAAAIIRSYAALALRCPQLLSGSAKMIVCGEQVCISEASFQC